MTNSPEMKKAREIMKLSNPGQYDDNLENSIAQALLEAKAEQREAIAKMFEDNPHEKLTGKYIAQAIREQKP